MARSLLLLVCLVVIGFGLSLFWPSSDEDERSRELLAFYLVRGLIHEADLPQDEYTRGTNELLRVYVGLEGGLISAEKARFVRLPLEIRRPRDEYKLAIDDASRVRMMLARARRCADEAGVSGTPPVPISIRRLNGEISQIAATPLPSAAQ